MPDHIYLDGCVNDGETKKGIGQMQLSEHEENGRQQRLVGNDQRKQQKDENELLAGHRKARQRVAGRNGRSVRRSS